MFYLKSCFIQDQSLKSPLLLKAKKHICVFILMFVNYLGDLSVASSEFDLHGGLHGEIVRPGLHTLKSIAVFTIVPSHKKVGGKLFILKGLIVVYFSCKQLFWCNLHGVRLFFRGKV